MSVVCFANRRVLLAAGVAALASASGCVGIGRDSPRHVSYRLDDPGRATPVQGPALDRVVLVSWSASNAFYDTASMVYIRTPGALAYYQFASWSERPADQIGRLFARRLAASGVFRDVATMSSAVQGDWLVDLQLDEMLHDDATPPGVARVAVFARIVDRSARRSVDTRRFVQEEPLRIESAAGAAQAFEAAVGRLLDAATDWVIGQARAAAPSRAPAPGDADARRAFPAAAR